MFHTLSGLFVSWFFMAWSVGLGSAAAFSRNTQENTDMWQLYSWLAVAAALIAIAGALISLAGVLDKRLPPR